MKLPEVPFSLCTFQDEGPARPGLVIGGRIWDVNEVLFGSSDPVIESMQSLLADWDRRLPEMRRAAENPPAAGGRSPDEVLLLAPVPAPGKMINAGLNFFDHAREMGMSIPDGFQPTFFWKGDVNCIIGPSQKIRLSSDFVDWEAEPAVVIGRTARNVSPEEALGCAAGYTCHNDVTDRSRMMLPDDRLDFLGGKSRDTFGPLGPVLVPSEFAPDMSSLPIRCLLNGETMQDTSTDQMVWDAARIISYLSQTTTLLPGDVVALGTGAGVGWAKGVSVGPGEMNKIVENMKSGGGIFLRPGDRIAVEIPGLGILENEVEAA